MTKILPKLLKDSVEVIAESLTDILKKFVEFDSFRDDDFEITFISPPHKGDCSNYRPAYIVSKVVANVF